MTNERCAHHNHDVQPPGFQNKDEVANSWPYSCTHETPKATFALDSLNALNEAGHS